MYRILIVDDEQFILEGLRGVIEASDLPFREVRVAASAEEALELFAVSPVDLVLSDISMPEMNGLEMVARMKEQYALVKVIFLTGYSEFAYARRALQLGSVDYLLKPVMDEELLEALDRTLRQIELPLEDRMERMASTSDNYQLKRIEQYIRQNVGADLSLSALSEKFKINPSYLSRSFHQTFGISLSAFITEMRIEKAKELLMNETDKIYEVAEKVGFDSPNYFAKVFSKAVNETPKEYRLRYASRMGGED